MKTVFFVERKGSNANGRQVEITQSAIPENLKKLMNSLKKK